MEIKEIRKFHDDKTYFDENGNKSTYKELTINKFKDEKMTVQILENIFDDNYMNLTLEQIESLRNESHKMNKIKGHDNNKVNLIYKEGFLMLSKCKEIKKIRRDMPYDIRGILEEISLSANKNGIVINDGNYPIGSVTDLCKYLEINDRVWSKFKKYNDKYKILKKEKIDGIWYIVLNPIFSSSQYELDFYRFVTFGNTLFESGFIDKYDYAYLCKKFEIIPKKV